MYKPGSEIGKRTYSSPELKKYSLCDFGSYVRGDEGGADKSRRLRVTPEGQPPLLFVEGFVGELDDLTVVLPLCNWAVAQLPQQSSGYLPEAPQSTGGPCILLMDLRRGNSGSQMVVRRVAVSSNSVVTLPIILCEAEPSVATVEVGRDSHRWLLKGPINSAGLVLLICCAFRTWMANKKATLESGFFDVNRSAATPLAACADRP